MKYFEVLVEIKTEIESKGGVKIKKVKESYLVDAMSVTEAEARVVQLFQKSGFSKDFEVVGVKGSRIMEVIEAPKKSADKPVTNIKI
jgi:hypothetical protein